MQCYSIRSVKIMFLSAKVLKARLRKLAVYVSTSISSLDVQVYTEKRSGVVYAGKNYQYL